MQSNKSFWAVFAVTSLAASIASPANTAEIQTVKVVERATTDVVTDIGDKGDSIGDILTFNNAVFDEANEKEIGRSDGHCIRTAVGQSWECFWTLTLDDGQITVQGPFLDKGDSVLAVTGGTGAYAGVKGEMGLHARNPEATEYDFNYSLSR